MFVKFRPIHHGKEFDNVRKPDCTYYVEKTKTESGCRFIPMTDMGHSDAGVTMNVYTHASYDHAKQSMQKILQFQLPEKALKSG